MAEERQELHKEENGRSREGRLTIRVRGESASAGELREIERYLEIAASGRRVEPSLEQWTRFNDRLFKRIRQTRRCRPLSRQWRRRLFDRLSAGDSRLREIWWVAVVLVALAFAFALAYLPRP